MTAFVTGGSGFVGRALLAALRRRGVAARALTRSDSAAALVAGLGAEPVPGDLDDVAALERGMKGCDVVYHAAAKVEDWGPPSEFQRVNVDGTAHVISAARGGGVPRLVHVSTEAVLVGGGPIRRAREDRPRPARPIGLYPASKGQSEALVVAASGTGLATVVVRPRFVWGKGDTTLVPRIAAMVRQGTFRWVGGGRFLTSTCHVENLCAGMMLAAERGRPGEIYFLTDGEPVEMKAFLTELLRTQGVDPGDKAIPRWAAASAAVVAETVWRALRLRGAPPITRTAVKLGGEEVTVDDSKARAEIGYTCVVSRDEGVREMAAAA